MNKIACVIPARLSSTRLPGKLLKRVAGKTILQRTYEQALLCHSLTDLYVATDSDLIATHVQEFGGAVIKTSSDCASGTDRVAQALSREPKLQQAAVIINLQGDHPLTAPTTLEQIAHILLSDPEAHMATAARSLRTWEEFLSPHSVKCVIDRFHNALYFSRASIPYSKNQKILPQGYLHIGLYGYRPSFLQRLNELPDSDLQRSEDLEQLKVLELGYRIKVAIVEDPAVGIDTIEDLEQLKKILATISS